MTDWQKRKLSDLADMCLGKMLDQNKNKGEFVPYLANINVRWGSIDLHNLREMRFEEKESERYGLKYGDIVMCEGGEPGRCAIWKNQTPSMMIQKALHRIRVKSGFDSFFLYYSLLNKGLNGQYDGYFTGAAIKHLTGENLAKVEVDFPPLSIQKKIGEVLAAYDDLIENNMKRIKLLEEMAQITYEEWFVRLRFPGHESTPINPETGLPEGWEKLSLSQIGEYLNGYAFKPKDLGDEGMPIIKIKEIKGGVVNDTPRNTGETIPEKYLVETGEILFSWSASLEVVIWQYERGLLNQHLFKVTPQKGVSKAFLFLALKEALKVFDGLTTGATMKHIKRKELDFVQTAVPDNRIMQKFDALVGAVIEEILNLSKQNQRLREARDILLPRLMTGVIDVESYDPAQLLEEAA